MTSPPVACGPALVHAEDDIATDGDKVAAAIIATGLANRNANGRKLQDTYVLIYEQVLALEKADKEAAGTE